LGRILAENAALHHWDGLIDEVGIWSRALSSNEVSQLYNNGDGLAINYDPCTPAYDATGTWYWPKSNCWTDCPGESPDPARANYVNVAQNGNDVSYIDSDGTHTGNVCGSDYNLCVTYSEDGGTVTECDDVTLTSNSAGFGATTWTWTDGDNSCSGGCNLTVSRSSPPWPSVYARILPKGYEADNLKVLKGFRDEILAKNPASEKYLNELYRHSFETALILLTCPVCQY
jgi:hypothetical protein